MAASAWSDVQKQLDIWDQLDIEQRSHTTLIVFAVATIVNDVRVLYAAIEKVDELQSDLDKAKREIHRDQRVRSSHRIAGWWERLSFQMPIALAALGVMAGAPFLAGI